MASTRLHLGPADHGRPLTWDEYQDAEYQGRYKYEIIRGRLEVSPLPNRPEHRLEAWLHEQLILYRRARPEVINHVSAKSRVFVNEEADPTSPEPDVCAYRDYPDDDDDPWADVSPILVCEVLVDGDPRKDLERNPPLYLAVPEIQEYWVIDGRGDHWRPTLIVHRRAGAAWAVTEVAFGATYTTPLLPGFELVIDPRR